MSDLPKIDSATSFDSLAGERLASLINSMADGVIAVDEGLNVVIYNGAAINILDRNDSIDGKQLANVFQPVNKQNQPVDVTALVRAAETPTASRDLRLPYGDGSTASLYVNIAPVRLGYGEAGQKGYVIMLRDITREKSLEEERDEFISVASHELRTPIAITEGNISNAQFIAEKTGDMTQVKAALKAAHDQVMFLADLVNDLSMLSRAERGAVPQDIAPIDIPALLSDVVHNYEPQAAAKGLALSALVDESHPPQLTSSKLYVREVLQNFITNAIKYTEAGSIKVAVSAVSDGAVFAVSDTGIGISKSDQQRVFQKFFRSGDFRTTKASGTGLGLYVTAKLARLLQADINVHSVLNHGSTFSIHVPNLKPSEPDSAPR